MHMYTMYRFKLKKLNTYLLYLNYCNYLYFVVFNQIDNQKLCLCKSYYNCDFMNTIHEYKV